MTGVKERGPTGGDDDEFDLDRQLQEAKVLRKYRLYDNAIAHLDAIYSHEPHNVPACELRVEILVELERREDLADAWVALGEALRGTEPARASQSAKEALSISPQHANALRLQQELGPDTVAVRSPLDDMGSGRTLAEGLGRTPPADSLDLPDFDEDSELELAEPEDSFRDLDLPAASDEDSDFSISVDDEDDLEEEEETFDVEDRFGLPDEVEALPSGGIEDVTEEVEDIEGLLAIGREEDARQAFLEFERAHPGHPALSGLSERFSDAAQGADESMVAEVAAAPLFDFEDDEEADDYLADIFSSEESEPEPAGKKVEHKARAQVAGGGDVDAATQYDLGTAYKEMGLVDDAIAAFTTAASDPSWTAKANVMMAHVYDAAGRLPEAKEKLADAIDAAISPDEENEARYLLGEILLREGDKAAAREQFEQVSAGFRDREAQLASL
jgi:tetratricopeptide (TPR) repeat protein